MQPATRVQQTHYLLALLLYYTLFIGKKIICFSGVMQVFLGYLRGAARRYSEVVIRTLGWSSCNSSACPWTSKSSTYPLQLTDNNHLATRDLKTGGFKVWPSGRSILNVNRCLWEHLRQSSSSSSCPPPFACPSLQWARSLSHRRRPEAGKWEVWGWTSSSSVLLFSLLMPAISSTISDLLWTVIGGL